MLPFTCCGLLEFAVSRTLVGLSSGLVSVPWRVALQLGNITYENRGLSPVGLGRKTADPRTAPHSPHDTERRQESTRGESTPKAPNQGGDGQGKSLSQKESARSAHRRRHRRQLWRPASPHNRRQQTAICHLWQTARHGTLSAQCSAKSLSGNGFHLFR